MWPFQNMQRPNGDGATNVRSAAGTTPTINLSTPPVTSFFVLRSQTHDFHYALAIELI
jgi:hypothetical protein